MKINSVCVVAMLAAVWVILHESVTLTTLAGGIAAGYGCVWLRHKLIPLPLTPDYSLPRLFLYPFFLLLQVYIAGFSAIRVILTGAYAETVEIKTGISSLFLLTVLVNSISVVPGSISLDLKGDTITVLCLKRKNARPHKSKTDEELLKGRMEKMLLKAQREIS